MQKPLKLILVLLVGLGLLALLSFLSVTFLFKDSGANLALNNNDSIVNITREETSAGAPDANYSPTPEVISKDVMPIYDGGNIGDGSKLVKSGFISMSVKDFDVSVAGIKGLVTTNKGYVVSLYDSGVENKRAVSISVRVPSDKFDSTLSEIKKLGIDIVTASENSDDISATYKDIQARLKNQKAYEKQLLSILNKASKVADILNIQKEIAVVRQEIELMEGQLKSYDTQVSMSVISVSMSKASEALDVTGQSWKPQGVFAEALTALVSFGKGIATLLIWAVVFSPVVLVPYGIYYFVRKGKSNA